jgi:aspartate/methionine/tyrosine aminotransferase
MKRLSRRSGILRKSPLHEFFNKKISLEAEGVQVINSGVGEPHNDTPEVIANAGIEGIKNGNTRYTPVKGTMELRKQIKKNLKNEGLNYDINSIVASAGAKPVINALLQILVDPGVQVLVPAPYYPPFVTVTEFIGAETVIVDTTKDDFQLTVERIEEAIINSHSAKRRIPRVIPKVLVLNTPNNPTGVVYTKDNLIKIAKLAEKYDLWVISDESYYEFVYDSEFISPASLPGMKERTIIVRALSKGYAMTGWRIGYVVGPEEVIGKLSLYFENMNGCSSSVSQYAALEALKNDDIPQVIREEFLHNRKVVSNWLEGQKIPFVSPDGAFYFFADFSKIIKKLKLRNATELAEYILEKAEVAVTPGVSFGGQYESYLRISYSIQREKLIEAIEKIDNIIY